MKNKGITLIALIITIIVLLILAGVSLTFLIGENGVLTRATEMELEYSKVEIEEAIEMKINEKLMEGYEQTKDVADISTVYNESQLIPYLTNTLGYITAIGTEIPDVQGNGTTVSTVYRINPTVVSEEVDRYGKGETIADGDIFTLEVITEDVDDGAGGTITKSTGRYQIKYYDHDGNDEVIATISLYLTNDS